MWPILIIDFKPSMLSPQNKVTIIIIIIKFSFKYSLKNVKCRNSLKFAKIVS